MKSPAQVVILFFVITIVIGTVLLSLPVCSIGKHSLIDNFFTITSATCVTGLNVVNISSYTRLGQLVILLCIQVGGLGYMLFGSLLMIIFGRVSLGQESVLSESLNLTKLTKSSNLVKIIKQILVFTLVIEFIGAGILFLRFYSLSLLTLSESIFFGMFHSISAFCNAGFCLFPDSLEQFRGDVLVNVVISGLIVVGGIGFIVGLDVIRSIRKKEEMLFHSRLVLMLSGCLIVIGMVLIFLLNRKEFSGLNLKEQLLTSWFQSVTPRTAGFNTFPINQLSGLSLLVITILMFIGGSPGSTGGGIKTITFFVVLYFSYLYCRGEKEFYIFKRRLREEVVIKSFVIFTVSIGFIILMSGFLKLSSNFGYKECLFETVSAFSTVGLSLGITPNLDNLSKILLIITMFLGRVGSLTLLTALLLKEPKEIKYLVENVSVG